MKNFLGKRLAVIVAHPDDESFAAAGTIYANNKAGGECLVICATRGGKGKSHLKKPVTVKKLKNIRLKEFKKVVAYLQIKDFKIFDFPDGKVKENREKLYSKLLPVVKKFNPEIILSFGEDGMSGHLDHIAAGGVARKIARHLKISFIAFSRPPQLAKRVVQFKKRRRFGVYAKKILILRPNLKIAIDPKIKSEVLKFHKSQFDEKSPAGSFLKFKFEYFRKIT